MAAPGLTTATPEAVGMDPERLQRLRNVIQGFVDRGEIAGAVTLIARQGHQIDLNAFGMADIGDERAMRTDTLFRIASMTKPITSVAVMMLYEEGHFLLNDPIADYLPEFGAQQALVPSSGNERAFELTPARPVTIRHLLTHTSGIVYRFSGDMEFDPRVLEVASRYKQAGVPDGLAEFPGTLADLVTRLSRQPLAHQPGERFTYGLSTDVLARLVEVTSGQPFDVFLKERIFAPLKMQDTFFYVPQKKVSRLASVYTPATNATETLQEVRGVVEGEHLVYSPTYSTSEQRSYFSGGAGLTSSAQDYSRFLQMLLNNGELNGVRLLSPASVELMTVNHLPPETVLGAINRGSHFGLGFAIAQAPGADGELGNAGSYVWGGFFNTRFWVDPEDQLIGIIMTQRFPNDHIDIADKFRVMAYQSIVRR